MTLTCTRSTDESTKRVVPPPAGSSPSTYQGSVAWRSSIVDTGVCHASEDGIAEFEVRGEPGGSKEKPAVLRSSSTSRKSPAMKCGSMNRSWSWVPQAIGRPLVGLLPEPGDQRAHQQLLCQAHARVRRHLEAAEFQQSEAAGRGVGRVQLVDAELGAMRVAGAIDQDVAEDAIDQPGRNARSPIPGIWLKAISSS